MNELPSFCTRVICASFPRIKGSVIEELLAMRGAVSAFNELHGLRAAFLFTGGWFIQWLEGPEAGIEKALKASRADARHHHLRVLHRSLGAGTLADRLQIASTHGAEKATDVARRLHSLKRSQQLESPAAPLQLWQQLAAPWREYAAYPGAGLVQQHVVAITSEATQSVDLVRFTGERLGQPVTYQRFASGATRSSDVGAAYVDLPGAGHVTRLQALSRRSLSHPLVRLALRQVHCIVLLLGADERHAEGLASEVDGLLHRLDVRPAFRLAASAPASARSARARLRPAADVAEIDAQALRRGTPADLFAMLLAPPARPALDLSLA